MRFYCRGGAVPRPREVKRLPYGVYIFRAERMLATGRAVPDGLPMPARVRNALKICKIRGDQPRILHKDIEERKK